MLSLPLAQSFEVNLQWHVLSAPVGLIEPVMSVVTGQQTAVEAAPPRQQMLCFYGLLNGTLDHSGLRHRDRQLAGSLIQSLLVFLGR